MTGFGRCEVLKDSRKFTVELKKCESQISRCKHSDAEEIEVFSRRPSGRSLNHMQTGERLTLFITYEDLSQSQVSVKYNAALAAEYLKYLNQMAEEFSLDNDVRVSTLSRYPEVFTMEECSEDEDELWNGLKEALEGAFSQFVEMRTKEGERLKEDILLKLDLLSEQIRFIEERSPQIIAEYRTKLEEKMRELLEDTQIDDNRIAAEVILFADKICTDEEVVRLKSHIQHMKETLEESNGIGRKLDFIAQEMNREANTILSKANDLDISNRAISLKTEIEKIREQIQNIE